MKLSHALPDVLLPWYQENRRDLPWRRDQDPYHVWISEIMLQQTRVEAVRGYYTRFLSVLPDIPSLARCDEETLSKLWEGLGYYSRMRNLKKAACIIMETYGGQFPRQYEDVISLPGIGAYTAGAICSIAFHQKTPAVDGNVLRVVSRLCSDPTPIDQPAFRKAVSDALREIYPDDTASFTQALMELGATICGPNKAPDCEHCPCNTFCKAYQQGVQNTLPVKAPKKARKEEIRSVFILRCEDRYAIEKRPDTGLLASLWQFPNIPGYLDTQEAIGYIASLGLSPVDITRQAEKTHIFTHITWKMRGFYLTVREPSPAYTWVTAGELTEKMALPTAFRQFWEEEK